MSPAPLVSAIVPSYNHARWVEGALRSVLAQRGLEPGALEVVVVDDGSRDESPAILQRLAAEEPRIRLELRQNQGISATFNRGLELARGTWAAYCCSDDRWDEDHLQRALAALARDPAAVVSYGRARLLDGAGQAQAGERIFAEFQEREPLRRLLEEGNGLCFVAAVFRREAALAAGGFDPGLVVLQDYDLWLKLARAGPAVHVLEPTVGFRWDGENASGPRATVQKRLDLIRVLERALVELPELQRDAALRAAVEERLRHSHLRVARRLPERARRREHLRAARRLGAPVWRYWTEMLRTWV